MPQSKFNRTGINLMRSDLVASAAKAAPPVGANLWIWFTSHDINWVVAIFTLVYLSLQIYVLVRDKLFGRGKPSGDEGGLV
jgi:hypothetical protein